MAVIRLGRKIDSLHLYLLCVGSMIVLHYKKQSGYNEKSDVFLWSF